jgi:protein involved in polysaccharide export with SLBB domain
MVAGLIVAMMFLSSLCLAKDYRIGPEDVLEIKFWQDDKLNTVVRVGQDGKIALDIIGQIDAGGKTTEELQDEIVRQMSRISKNISQCVVRVQAYNSNYVFVTGQVKTPGKRAFEQIPDLWSIINEAGGVGEAGDLTQVAIVRAADGKGKPEIVNVAAIVASGKLENLPEIHRGDYIDVPRTTAGLPSQSIGRSAEAKNYVYVLGAVGHPSSFTFEENTDLLELLTLAGGPTATANLKKVRVVSHDGSFAQTMQIDMEKYSRTGAPARYIVKREDAVIVPDKGQGLLGSGAFTTITATVGVITSLILVINQVKK